MSRMEDAAARMHDFTQSDIVRQLRGANEAETRLLIIDEVLGILGWPKVDFKPEQRTTTGGYTDYLLQVDGKPRLIVEAKRLGLFPSLPRTLQNPEYANSFLWTSCGTEVQDLLDQCRRYCSDCGVPFALATTGEVWIVLAGFRYGVEWGKLRSVVFHSLADVAARFSEFYGLVSREAVKENSLEDKFNNLILVRPTIAIRPRDHVQFVTETIEVPERRYIEAYFDHFMDDITKTQDMLEHCYVKTRELTEFSKDLQQLLEYDPVLDELDIPVDEADEQRLEQEIALQQESGMPRTILLVGNVGAGKSTFMHRFLRSYARPRKNICVIVDLINEAAIDSQHDRAEEQHISGLVLEWLARTLGDAVDPYDPGVMRGCFEVELNRFGKQRRYLLQQDPAAYRLEEETHLIGLASDKYKHLVGYIRYTRKKFSRIWIAFDNVDRGSESFQRFVYAFAHRLSSDAKCATLITLREDTFLEAQQAGFLDVRRSDTVLRITAPEFKQIVSKRRKYVDRLLQQNGLPKPLKSHSRLVNLLNAHIKHLILGNADGVRLLIVAFSMNNVREAFGMLRDYYSSYHSTFHDYYGTSNESAGLTTATLCSGEEELSRFLQGLMLQSGWSYKESTSPVFNVFHVEELEQGSHFLTLHLLAYLSREANTASTGAVKIGKIAADLVYVGHQRRHIDTCVRRLLSAGLVISPNLPPGSLRDQTVDLPDPLPIDLKLVMSPKGYYHFNVLACHPYYQSRVSEDTIWYDKELVELYITCLEESHAAHESFVSLDPLSVTQARDIFLQYLRRSLQEENQSGSARYLTKEWARLMGDSIERKVFGEPITATVYASDSDMAPDPARVAAGQRAHGPSKSRLRGLQPSSSTHTVQLDLFADLEVEGRTDIDIEGTLRQATLELGLIPAHVPHASRNVARILWALEIASRVGLGIVRATDITTILVEYANESVTLPNVAKFIRIQKRNGTYTHLWKEEPAGYYRISAVGRAMLGTLLSMPEEASTAKLRADSDSTDIDRSS